MTEAPGGSLLQLLPESCMQHLHFSLKNRDPVKIFVQIKPSVQELWGNKVLVMPVSGLCNSIFWKLRFFDIVLLVGKRTFRFMISKFIHLSLFSKQSWKCTQKFCFWHYILVFRSKDLTKFLLQNFGSFKSAISFSLEHTIF